MKTRERTRPARDDHHEMSRYLMRKGFGGLDSPDLFYQLAFMITSHELFRDILMKVGDPLQRSECYKALAPKLRFKAHSLEKYIDMIRDYAKESAAKHDSPDDMNKRAQALIEYEAAKMTLTLTCGKCLAVMVYPCRTSRIADRNDAVKLARKEGWVRQELEGGREMEVCPKCPAYRGEIVIANA